MRLFFARRTAVGAVLLCCAAAAAASTAEPPGPALAERDARALLGRLDLPPGAARSEVDPTGDQAMLAAPGSGPSATPNAVDIHAWWVVPLAPAETLRWLREHPPAGSTLTARGRGGPLSGPTHWLHGFSWAPVRERLRERALVVSVTGRADGGTALRADGQSVWVVPRPSWRIPRARSVSVMVLPGSPTEPRAGPSLRRTADPAKVRRLARILDRLSLVQPGARSCPPRALGAPAGYRVIFHAGHGGPPVASAHLSVESCHIVALRISGRPLLRLEGWDPALRAAIGSILGTARPRSHPPGAAV